MDNTAYKNPWMSDYIGDPATLFTPTGNPATCFNASVQSNGKGLLQKLQSLCAMYEQFITNAAEVYFKQLKIGSVWQVMAWYIVDTSFMRVTVGQTPIPKSWYGQCRQKYGIQFYAPEFWFFDGGGEDPFTPPTIGPDPNDVKYTFMLMFHLYLNSPCDDLVRLRKMAGFTDGLTGTDYWNNICNDLFTNGRPNLLPPKKPLPVPLYDPSGGYPFGIGGPSYKQAIQKWIDVNGYKYGPGGNSTYPPNPNAPNIFGPLSTDDDYNFGSFCTPIVSVQPNEEINLDFFNNPGSNVIPPILNISKCSNPNTVGVISCLKSLNYPGTLDNPTMNSRNAFCVNNDGSTSLVESALPPALPISTTIFNYTGQPQYFEIPIGVSYLTYEAWGAGGGCGASGTVVGSSYSGYQQSAGGGGGFQSGTITQIKEGDLLTIVVGGGGQAGMSQLPPSGAKPTTKSFGGGGQGTPGIFTQNNVTLKTCGGGGGGASSILINTTTTLFSAGGGGGGSMCLYYNPLANPSYTALTSNYYNGGASGQGGYSNNTPYTSVLVTCGGGGSSAIGGNGGKKGIDVVNTGAVGVLFAGGDANSDNSVAGLMGAGGGGGGAYGGGAGGTVTPFVIPGSISVGGTSGGGGGNGYLQGQVTLNSPIDPGAGRNPGGTTNSNYVSPKGSGGNPRPQPGDYSNGNGYNGFIILSAFA